MGSGAGVPHGVRRTLVLLAILTLPFTYALTLDLRFPFKIYELALIGVGLTCLAQWRIPTIWRARRAAVPAFLLVFLALATLVLHRWITPEGMTLTGFTSRFGPVGDALAKIVYLGLAIFAFLVIAHRAHEELALVLRVWLIGAITASVYAWYLVASSFAGLNPLLLPGIDPPQLIGFADRIVIRSGTFEEGNFLGLYLVLSSAVALFARRQWTAIFLSATVLITFSTVNLAGVILLWTIIFLGRSREVPLSRRVLYALSFSGVLLVAGTVAVSTGYFESVIVGKLFGEDSLSRIERLNQTVAGLRMFADHPIAGVGISQYGYYHSEYQLIDLGALSGLGGQKRIPNNVYVELLSELGIAGFALGAWFMRQAFRSLRSPDLLPLRAGVAATLLVWLAFPTYTVMFLWAFFAVAIAAGSRSAAASVKLPADGSRLSPETAYSASAL